MLKGVIVLFVFSLLYVLIFSATLLAFDRVQRFFHSKNFIAHLTSIIIISLISFHCLKHVLSISTLVFIYFFIFIDYFFVKVRLCGDSKKITLNAMFPFLAHISNYEMIVCHQNLQCSIIIVWQALQPKVFESLYQKKIGQKRKGQA